MFKKNLDYLLNNPKHHWFKQKAWSWVPVTWQGWFVMVLYFMLVLFLVFTREEAIPGNPDSGSNFFVFGLPIIFLTAAFVFIVYKKGKKPDYT